jgi:ABC-type Fe3+-hydroxamate transport system substrate-binding protein
VAEAVDRSEEAQELLEDFDTSLADGAEQIKKADAAGRGFVLADGYLGGCPGSRRT